MSTTVNEPVIQLYPLPGNTGANGRVLLFGKPDSKYVLLMCAGFPDDCMSSFVPMAQQLTSISSEFLCGVTCLPGYDYYLHSLMEHKYKIDGYTFPEMVTSLRDASNIVKGYSTNPDAQYIGIFHDWGCVIGSLFSNRENDALELFSKNNNSNATTNTAKLFDKLVYMDVLPPPHRDYKVPPEQSIAKKVMEVSYRIVFGISFVLYRYVNTVVASIVFGTGMSVLKVLKLAPESKYDDIILQSRNLGMNHSNWTMSRVLYMCYPYWNLMKLMFWYGSNEMNKVVMNDYHLPKDIAYTTRTTPVLYMYGINKSVNFHDSTWLDFLKDTINVGGTTTSTNNKKNEDSDNNDNNNNNDKKVKNHNKIVPVDQAGHWFYLQHPELSLQEIKQFVCDN